MRKLWVIAVKDIGEAFRSKSTYFYILIMAVLSVTYISNYTVHVNSLTNQRAIKDYSRIFLNIVAYTLPMMYSIFICTIFANYSVVLDKAKRNIESLMATPVSIRQIWVGKSLAITLPSLAIGLAISIIVYVIINIGFVVPKAHLFVVPSALAIVSVFILIPLSLFSVVMIVTEIQLTITNPRIASLVFTGIFILLIFSINALGGLGLSVGYYALIYVGVIVLCALIALILARSLTKEKVLLSSKI
jgi:ABC-2 type transport system permease protein